jgi:hypothetical protein
MLTCSGCDGFEGLNWGFSLTLSRTGDTYAATLHVEPWGFDAALTGSRAPDGSLVLSGPAPAISASLLGADFRDVVLREDAAGGLTGTFRYAAHRAEGLSATATAEIASATQGTRPPAASFAGAWAGTGRANNRCTSDWGCTDPAFGLILVQQGTGYTGFFDLIRAGHRVALAVSGSEKDGTLVLTGSVPPPAGMPQGIAHEVTRLALRLDPSGSLIGDYEYREFQSGTTDVKSGAIVSGTRRSTPAQSSFQGEWLGEYVQRHCTGDCLGPSINTYDIPLTLTQSGAVVRGRYATEFELKGSAAGGRLVLEGGDENPGCVTKDGRVCSERLKITVTRIDQWGVMSGTAEHTWNGKYDRWTKSGELWKLARQIR